jgi:hypothetical protein
MEIQLDPELSLAMALIIGAEPFQCWRNAMLVVLQFPEFTYVEGWIVLPGKQSITIMEHGWSISPMFRIVDPSIVLLEVREQEARYFPGFEIAGHEFLLRIPGQVLPFVCHAQYGEDGMGHEGYKQAYDNAWQYARELAQERQLPLSAISVSTRSDNIAGITIVIEDHAAQQETRRPHHDTSAKKPPMKKKKDQKKQN